MNFSRNYIKGWMMMSCGLGGSLIPSISLQAQDAEKPNIIFIMADDHANRAISAYGGGINNTPNIDRIAMRAQFFAIIFVPTPFVAPAVPAFLPESTVIKMG